jgi:hypothetical protein
MITKCGTLRILGLSLVAATIAGFATLAQAQSNPWQQVTAIPSQYPKAANPLLMIDGTVIVHVDSTAQWLRLTPDINGNYATGKWSTAGKMPAEATFGSPFLSTPSPYAPRFFASEVLPDGNVIVNGGEYIYQTGTQCIINGKMVIGYCPNRGVGGALYDFNTGGWRAIAPPTGWASIGDSPSTVRDDGTYMLSSCCDQPPVAALFDESNFTFSTTGSKKFDVYDEEGWSNLPNGEVLTVDAWVFTGGACGATSEIYNPVTGSWSPVTGGTAILLADCPFGQPFPSNEMGPTLLRPDGTVVAFGATTEFQAGISIYNSGTGLWSSLGFVLPIVSDQFYTNAPYILADAPAALLPDGNILFAASPGDWTSSEQFPCPTHFFEMAFGTNTITQVADNDDNANNTPGNPLRCVPSDPMHFPGLNSYQWNFLVLPTGQVLATETDTPNVWIYTNPGTPNPAWAPVIDTYPATVTAAQTYQLTGTQFNGLSQGANYGDDVQGNTNYPVVRIVTNKNGHVYYQPTWGGNTRSMAPGVATTVNFTVTGAMAAANDTGASTLYVVANGIASSGVAIVVQ